MEIQIWREGRGRVYVGEGEASFALRVRKQIFGKLLHNCCHLRLSQPLDLATQYINPIILEGLFDPIPAFRILQNSSGCRCGTCKQSKLSPKKQTTHWEEEKSCRITPPRWWKLLREIRNILWNRSCQNITSVYSYVNGIFTYPYDRLQIEFR